MKQKRQKSKNPAEYLVLVAIVIIVMLAAVSLAVFGAKPGSYEKNAAPVAVQSQTNANPAGAPPSVAAPVIATSVPSGN